jgi:hypothetical protein
MAKLDEITAVLSEELEGFKNTVQKMEQLTKELNGSQTRTDIARTREEVSGLKETQDNHFQDQRMTINQMEHKLNNAKLTPKWLLGLFCITILSTMLVLGYGLYRLNKVNDIRTEAYKKGKNDTAQHVESFFKAYPEAKGDYGIWLLKQDEDPKQK